MNRLIIFLPPIGIPFLFGELGGALAHAEELDEGAYTCVSALQLAQKAHIAVPITEAVYATLYQGSNPRDEVKSLLQRAIKEERL